MNIFVLDTDPQTAAQYHCDKHVVKMVLETAQILSAVHHRYHTGGPKNPDLYRLTHERHPCTLWAGETRGNYKWLVELGSHLGLEYRHRYGKTHKSAEVIRKLCEPPAGLSNMEMTTFKQCMPTHLIAYQNPVLGYRRYYNREKAHFCTWRNRETPFWFKPGEEPCEENN